MAAHERIEQSAILNHIAVEFPHSVLVRAETLRYFAYLANADVHRQLGVDGLEQCVASETGRGVKVGDLADGVNAGIGAAAAIDANTLFLRDRGDGPFEHLLHRAAARLPLPAEELRAVVADDEPQIAHGEEPGSN